MIPVLTPEEMKAVDAAASEPVEALVERAGAAVARRALDLLGGSYGRRVTVVTGKGNNGADGRAAAARLRRRGVRVELLDAASDAREVPACDLVVDAAFGTGFHGEYRAPDPLGAPVLAVDIPSGLDGLTGEAADDAVWADATITFAALKPGLVLADGPERTGVVELADIGLDVSEARAHVVQGGDVVLWMPPRSRDAHKWQRAVWVVAGSPGMAGAASLCARAALRAGAGYARLGSPGVDAAALPATEVTGLSLPAEGWADAVLADLGRFGALVVGPGLGRSAATVAAVQRVVAGAPVPVLVDGDGLFALGTADEAAALVRGREHPTVLTPHDGEFARLTGGPPAADRLGAARAAAATTGATVLLKGSTTVVAEPGGRALLSLAGDRRLATAGTGDVLSGVVGALLADSLDGLRAAAAGAYVHGLAGRLGPRRGLVAGDLLELLPRALSDLAIEARPGGGPRDEARPGGGPRDEES